ncbi:MAG: ATP-binding cassette domain-containing protein [Nitrosopumilaceae archaeon]|nr:ABC transporter ATP-binding protein [Nitrosopumilaceae archaeon]NIU00803.1 ABC transporter ATP-binding protein [Nitrosopumilaceae archaeon]NIU87256.1 ATP-binding cassette domain-containing protein [Nitrosopumilaceae archaeon]NIV65784.1 ATP-binding cassette domain-containing protein [Nitrosopumilaceae archaeon]NIX61405.1 ATP-binding cassette domain-containing protein [Nitrosopumilaceae archaeon]
MVLEVKDVSKEFGEGTTRVRALKEVSFTIKRGEFVLIVGTSGSGKSTLLNLIGLLDNPTSGKIILDGKDTTNLSDNQRSQVRNNKIGFIFQFSNLLPDLSILENVTLPRYIQGRNNRAVSDSKNFLDLVDLSDQLEKRANKVSGGQAQRAAIARGLVNNPSIILADEPTGNLDSVTAYKIVHLMKSMCKKLNQTFLVVTHDREQFTDPDRVITIKDGIASEDDVLSMEIQK